MRRLLDKAEYVCMDLLQVIVPEVEKELGIEIPRIFTVRDTERNALGWFKPSDYEVYFNIPVLLTRALRISEKLGIRVEDTLETVVSFTIYHEFKHVHQMHVLKQVHRIGKIVPVYHLSKEIEADEYAASKTKHLDKGVYRAILEEKRKALKKHGDGKRAVAELINKTKKAANL